MLFPYNDNIKPEHQWFAPNANRFYGLLYKNGDM